MAVANTFTPGQGNGIEAFFERCGLPADTRLGCQSLAREFFPDLKVEEISPQGYCSYTLCVGVDTIVQFRPPAYKLSIGLAQAAHDVYGDLVPETKQLAVLALSSPSEYHESISIDGRPLDEGVALDDPDSKPKPLDVISMPRMRGISLAEFRSSPQSRQLAAIQLKQQRESVVRDFAKIIATGWAHRRPPSDPVVTRLRGRVGGSVRWRLEQMAQLLPHRFQPAAESILSRLEEMLSLPWVLTHGDIVPANIMVQVEEDKTTRPLSVTGLIDWAEAEYLPFGVGLYGLEELLGESDSGGRFSYFIDRHHLCDLFWTQLEKEISREDLDLAGISRELLEAARLLGVLLWHGIAFDDGNLDRVVETGKDEAEIERLDLFYMGCVGYSSSDLKVDGEDALASDSQWQVGRTVADIWARRQRITLGGSQQPLW